MSEDPEGSPLDVTTLELLARRGAIHPLVVEHALVPDAITPRRLELGLDTRRYPEAVTAVRLDVRWYEDGDYTVHYVEHRGDETWQCRWDRHPKPGSPREHVHPPPDAAAVVRPSPVETAHPLGVLFDILAWIGERIGGLHDQPEDG